MEPETSLPKSGQERAFEGYGQSIERAPQPSTPESGIETGAERREQAAEAAAAAADSSGLPTVLPGPAPTSVSDEPVVSNQQSSASPLVANDDDLIEKEWVDRAKKIVSETKEDPYKREAAVTELQKDYQKKRYGRELGEA